MSVVASSVLQVGESVRARLTEIAVVHDEAQRASMKERMWNERMVVTEKPSCRAT